MPYTEQYLKTKLERELKASFVKVEDQSDGCGDKFVATIVSPLFEGKPLLQRHRLVNSVLEGELKTIHAFSQRTLTPQQWDEQKAMKEDYIQLEVSAPGKVVLFGEHGVVYDKAGVAAALELRTTLLFTETGNETVRVKLPSVNLDHTFSAVNLHNPKTRASIISALPGAFTDSQVLSMKVLLQCCSVVDFACPGLSITVTSDLTVGAGQGSSASYSLVLATAFLLYKTAKVQPTELSQYITGNNTSGWTVQEALVPGIMELTMACEKLVHGTPSGLDHTVALRGSALRFRKTGGTEPLPPIPIRVLMVDTRVARSTKDMVRRVAELKERRPKVVDTVLEAINEVALSAIQIIKKPPEDFDTQFAELVQLNHKLLGVLGVSHPSLEEVVALAASFGLQAKLTGAGGGGFAFVFLPHRAPEEDVAMLIQELTESGFSVLETSLAGPGLKVAALEYSQPPPPPPPPSK